MKISRRNTAELMLAATVMSFGPNGANSAPKAQGLRVTIDWQAKVLGVDTLKPRFKWAMSLPVNVRGKAQSAFQLRINDIVGNPVFDTGRLRSEDQAFLPASDLPLHSQSFYEYHLQTWDQEGGPLAGARGSFATGLLSPAHNHGQWLATAPDIVVRPAIEGHWHRVDTPTPLPLFRKILTTEKPVRKAHLCIAGLGQYQIWIDGNKVSPEGVNGGWTRYDKRVLYDVYDVSERFAVGKHLLGVALGNGFFNVEVLNGRYSKLDGTFGRPQMWAQLRLIYADGSEDIITSDATWQTRYGGTTYSSIYGGEDFDARHGNGGFHSEAWRPATVIKGPAGKLESSTFRPMVLYNRLKARSKTQQQGLIIYDFGLNHSGRPSIRFKNLGAGTVIRMVPSELLGEDGKADQQSMVGGKERGYRGIAFTYTARGGKTEAWSPQFTYTGYRYLQVEGVDESHIEFVESHFLSNDVAKTGAFTCSDKRMELIHGLIDQALLSNSASVLTDCPQREKLGWLEQIYLNGATAMLNRDNITVYEKMMADIRDAQEPSGMLPTIAPEFTRFVDADGKDTRFRDSPEWGAAMILGAWQAFTLHGDTQILSANYEAMVRRIVYLETRLGTDGMLDYGLGDWFDIGPKKPGSAQLTSRKMTGTATFYAELATLAKIARRLDMPDVEKFEVRAEALKRTMQAALFDPARAVFDTGSQCAQAMALVLDLVPGNQREEVFQVLIDDIRSRENHVSAGDIGFHYVVRALTEGRRSDVLHDMLTRTDKPAYLEQVKNGATALTEAWDGGRESSHNHFMLGHAEIWFYQGLGGLDIDFTRSSHPIVLAPQVVTGIEDQGASYLSRFGKIGCRLRREGKGWRLTAEIPIGQAAKLVLPGAIPHKVRADGMKLSSVKSVTEVKAIQQSTHLVASSGLYEFTW